MPTAKKIKDGLLSRSSNANLYTRSQAYILKISKQWNIADLISGKNGVNFVPNSFHCPILDETKFTVMVIKSSSSL